MQLFLSTPLMYRDIWGKDCLNDQEYRNQKMACILKKSKRRLGILQMQENN